MRRTVNSLRVAFIVALIIGGLGAAASAQVVETDFFCCSIDPLVAADVGKDRFCILTRIHGRSRENDRHPGRINHGGSVRRQFS